MAADLQGNVILVTGGAQGIGAATAKLCAARGARVIIADYKNDGEQRAAEIRAEGGTADFLQTDVRNEAEVAELFRFTLGCHGRLDKVVCAAGVLPGSQVSSVVHLLELLTWQSPEDMPTEDFRRALDVNITGVFLCAKYATPLLEASGRGVFVVIASGAGVFGPSSSLAYASGKGGANGLAMTLQAQLGERGIRVNTIYPGNIITEIKLSVDIAAARRDGRPEQDAHDHARAHYGLPEGVAKVIAFVLSDEADYLRGGVRTR